MKTLILALLVAAGCSAAGALNPVPHAILSETLDSVIGERLEDADLVDSYRRGPQSNKVARLRLIVRPPAPAVSLQEIAEPSFWAITETNATRSWLVRPKTAQEIAADNQALAGNMGERFSAMVARGQWEPSPWRVDVLQSELLNLVVKIILRANLQTNLSIPERQRAVGISNELATLRSYWIAARDARQFVLTNDVAVDPQSIAWPTNTIGE